jgi:hypothetical protein
MEVLPVKSFFDFIGRTEIEKYSRLSRNAETGDSDKEAPFASAGGVEVSEFLGGETGQASRGARRWSWTLISVQRILIKSFKGRGNPGLFLFS